MEPTELLAYVAKAFEKLGVPYAVVGSMASSYYGEARLTVDVDVLADLRLDQIGPFITEFPPAEFYVSADAIRDAIQLTGQFNIIHPTSGLKVDVMIPKKEDGFDALRLSRRLKVKQSGGEFEVYFAAPEDVILKKLDFYREGGSDKHLRDIAGMLKVSGDRIDRKYIEEWASHLGLSEIWQEVLARVG